MSGSWGDYTHSMESLYMLEMFHVEYDYIGLLKKTSDIDVHHFDEIEDGLVCIDNPKMGEPRFLSKNGSSFTGTMKMDTSFGQLMKMDKRKRDILISLSEQKI